MSGSFVCGVKSIIKLSLRDGEFDGHGFQAKIGRFETGDIAPNSLIRITTVMTSPSDSSYYKF